MRTSNRRAFTLVELMVVIAIIATLISILLPSLAAIRRNVKNTQTKVMISVLETGIEAFRADTRCGGSLPPSAAPPTGVSGFTSGQIVNPYTGSAARVAGANLLFWALSGADMLGTPGFTDLNGNGTWADDTGSADRAPQPLPLYFLNGSTPATPRSGPFVDLSKLKLPRPLDKDNLKAGFVVPSAKVNGTLATPCFLDSFDQPILYYKANPNKSLMVGVAFGAANLGIYNLVDNIGVTGLDGSFAGMDLGRGAISSSGLYHYAGIPGEGATSADPGVVLPAMQNSANPCFSRTIWNPNVIATPRPYNDKSFILLSAGADGVFGTPDDLANFEVNK